MLQDFSEFSTGCKKKCFFTIIQNFLTSKTETHGAWHGVQIYFIIRNVKVHPEARNCVKPNAYSY